MGALGQPKAMCVLDRMAAPQSMPLDTIRLFVVSKLGWISSQQRKLQLQERETPREFLNKESHYLWGKRHLLEISRADAAPAVSLSPKKLYPPRCALMPISAVAKRCWMPGTASRYVMRCLRYSTSGSPCWG